MKTKHLFEDGYYHLSNKAVAKCFLFGDERDCVRFKEKVDHHLSSLCDVVSFALCHDEFHLIVKLKSRQEIERYYLEKYNGHTDGKGNFIPETTYIFAQAMANLQSGYAKYFNYKYNRDGGLMRGRYFRTLIESEQMLDKTIQRVNKLESIRKRNSIWTFRRKRDGFQFELLSNTVKRSSYRCYEEAKDAELDCFKLKENIYLRGQFENLPPKQIEFKNLHQKVQNLIHFVLLKSK